MMSWIALAALAQLFNAVTVLVDKYVITCINCVGRTPVAYAFWVSLLSGFVIVLVPFGVVSWPSGSVIGLSCAVAFTYITSILLLYSALRRAGASDVVPVVGAVSAITTFSLAYVLLNQDLPDSSLLGLGLLIVGTALISHFRFTLNSFTISVFSGIFFGFSAILIKLIFIETTFIDGFFWSRMTNVVGALMLLAWPGNYKAIMTGVQGTTTTTKWIVVGNKALSGVAFALILFAISLGSVSVVNAMSGLQFVFLLSFAYLFADIFPAIFYGEIHKHKYFHHKLYGIIFIVFGLIALFIQ